MDGALPHVERVRPPDDVGGLPWLPPGTVRRCRTGAKGVGTRALQDCLAGTPVGKWVAANAHEHGFIVRYPQGPEHITGCPYEPWHLRYGGPGLVQDMSPEPPSSVFPTMEQYLGLGSAPEYLED